MEEVDGSIEGGQPADAHLCVYAHRCTHVHNVMAHIVRDREGGVLPETRSTRAKVPAPRWFACMRAYIFEYHIRRCINIMEPATESDVVEGI